MVATIGHFPLLQHSVYIHWSIKLKFGVPIAVASTYILDQKQGLLSLPLVLCSCPIMWGVQKLIGYSSMQKVLGWYLSWILDFFPWIYCSLSQQNHNSWALTFINNLLYWDEGKLYCRLKSLNQLASSPGHYQIFLHGCEIKSWSGLGTRLRVIMK